MNKFAMLPFALAMAATAQAQSAELEAPFRVQSAGEMIDVGDPGNAAPVFTDWDGDGLNDLLVGMFGVPGTETEGALRVYKNVGTATEPAFDGFAYVEAGGKTNLVPTD